MEGVTNLISPPRKAQPIVILDLVGHSRRQHYGLTKVADDTARLVGVGLEPVRKHLSRATHKLLLWSRVAKLEGTLWVEVLDVLGESRSLEGVHDDGQEKSRDKVGEGRRRGVGDGLDVEPLHPRGDGAWCGRGVGHGCCVVFTGDCSGIVMLLMNLERYESRAGCSRYKQSKTVEIFIRPVSTDG